MSLLRKSVILKNVCRTNDRRSITISSLARWKDGPLPEYGLQTRFLNFFEHSNKRNDNCNAAQVDRSELRLPTSIASATAVESNLSKNMRDNDNVLYNDLVESIKKQLLHAHSSPCKDSLELLDNECCKVLGWLSQSQVFRLLLLLTKAIPNDVASLRFYKNAVLTLRKMLEINRLDRGEILQLLYIESWRRKSAARSVKIAISFLPPLSELSLIERSVVAQSAYRCSVGLKYEDARALEETIEENASTLVGDTAILATICKAVRRAGPTSNLSLNQLSRAIVDHNETFHLMCTAHVTSLYAEARLECSDVLRRLFDDSMIIVSMNRQNKMKVRIKDVDRLLWASSIMNYKLRDSDIREISSFLDRRYDKLTKEPFYLANILLSLWILNFKKKRFAEKFFSTEIFRPIVEERRLWKPKARLHLLLTCVRIEAPEIALPKELAEPYKVGMRVSRSVKRLHNTIERLTTTLEINNVAIDCPVSGLYIAGVSLKRKELTIHVDLLDETTCFKGTTAPRGLMNLKLRLLSKIGVHSILIIDDQLNEPESLSAILRTRILNSAR